MKSFFFSRESAVDGGVGWEHPGQNPGYHKISVNTDSQLPLIPFVLRREDGSWRKEKRKKRREERERKKKEKKKREKSPGGDQFSFPGKMPHPIP